jgi:hypothetical protein
MITRVFKIDGDDHCCIGAKITKRSEYYGVSTDDKPTKGVINAEVFYEMDTKKVFMFDEDNQVWLEQ